MCDILFGVLVVRAPSAAVTACVGTLSLAPCSRLPCVGGGAPQCLGSGLGELGKTRCAQASVGARRVRRFLEPALVRASVAAVACLLRSEAVPGLCVGRCRPPLARLLHDEGAEARGARHEGLAWLRDGNREVEDLEAPQEHRALATVRATCTGRHGAEDLGGRSDEDGCVAGVVEVPTLACDVLRHCDGHGLAFEPEELRGEGQDVRIEVPLVQDGDALRLQAHQGEAASLRRALDSVVAEERRQGLEEQSLALATVPPEEDDDLDGLVAPSLQGAQDVVAELRHVDRICGE